MKTKTKSFPKTDVFVEVEGWGGQLLLGNRHSYWWKEEGKDPRPLPGITSVLGVIGKPALLPWAAKMACEHIRGNVAYVIPGQDGGFWAIKPSTVEEAQVAHTKHKEAAGEKGTDAHALIEEYIKTCLAGGGAPIPVDPTFPSERVQEFARWASSEGLTFLASETPLADPTLSIAGTPDFIAIKDGKVLIGDIKTGSGIYDRTPFLQMAAYGYMYFNRMAEEARPSMVIVHTPASKPEQALKTYWSHDWAGDFDLFTSALALYRGINNFAK